MRTVGAMTTPQPSGWFTGRTKLITIASIVAVGLAGATAVSANIGILNAADDSNVGTLSAAGDLVPVDTQVVDVYLDEQTSTTVAIPSDQSASGVQEYTVDAAGTVSVSATAAGIRLGDVTPSAGWTWSLVQPNAAELAVTFTDGVRTLEFIAVAAPDGTITASVNEPVIAPAPAAPSGTGQHESEDEEHEGGEDDD